MNAITCLLKDKLLWNRARLDCFALLVCSVLMQRSVNLVLLCLCSHSDSLIASAYRRFQRFFSDFAMPLDDVGALVLSLLPAPAQGFVLAMDRTNWQFGRKHINVLVVGVVFGKMCFPLAWMSLPQGTKKGNSNASQRIRLFKRVLGLIGAGRVRVLLMDREFIGKKWLGWLDAQGVGYVVRVKSNTLVGGMNAGRLTRRRRWERCASRRFEVFGQQVWFAAKTATSQRAGALQVISNRFCGAEALELYRLRWGIELFFSHLKSRGLNFEDTHLSEGVRIERLCAVLAVAFTLCYRNGARVVRAKAPALKKHGHAAKSVFRVGLEDFISAIYAGRSRRLAAMLACIQKPPPPDLFAPLIRALKIVV